MCSGEIHSALDLIESVVNEADRSLAMAAFVHLSGIQFVARRFEVIHCRLHVGLPATTGAAGEVTEKEQENEQTGDENRSTIHPDLPSPLMSSLF